MNEFDFDFTFQDYPYSAECRMVPIDGSTELHVTPLHTELFEGFGVRILMLQSDGSITARIPLLAEERDYILAIAEGLSNYFDNETSTRQ